MALSQNNKDVLIELSQDLTSGQLSTLVAALNEPNSQIGTSKQSANHSFLMKLVELGLAKEVPLGVEMPPTVTFFSIDDDARPEIADLIGSATGP